MQLTRQQKQYFTAQASKLNPIVLIGNKGLTDAVQLEIARGLHDHELIKIRFHSKDRDYQKQLAEEICKHHQAALVNRIGHIS